MMARKFETFIANCEDHKIVGMAFIEIPSKYAGKEKEFGRLQKTFKLLFGESIDDKYPKWFRDVKSLFSNKSCQDIYGEIQWNKVSVINCVDDADWKETLCQRVDDALNAKILLTEKQT
jgi:hypothetical protein